MIIALLLAPIFALIPGKIVEAAEDNRVGHLYCNFREACPDNKISDLAVGQEYLFSNKKLEKTYASTTFEPSFAVFRVDINQPYKNDPGAYSSFYYIPVQEHTDTKSNILAQLANYTNNHFTINMNTEVDTEDEWDDERAHHKDVLKSMLVSAFLRLHGTQNLCRRQH